MSSWYTLVVNASVVITCFQLQREPLQDQALLEIVGHTRVYKELLDVRQYILSADWAKLFEKHNCGL